MAYRSETPIPVKYMDITVLLFRGLVQEDEISARQQDQLDALSKRKVAWWAFFLEGPVYPRNRREKTIQICKAGYGKYSFIIWIHNNPWAIERSRSTQESESLRSNRIYVMTPFSISGGQCYLQKTVSKERGKVKLHQSMPTCIYLAFIDTRARPRINIFPWHIRKLVTLTKQRGTALKNAQSCPIPPILMHPSGSFNPVGNPVIS